MKEFCHGMGQSDEPEEAGIERVKIVKGGCVRDFDECDCNHHVVSRLPGVTICCQCCFACKHCGKNIKSFRHTAHEKECGETKTERP